jgi:hypothetical protein
MILIVELENPFFVFALFHGILSNSNFDFILSVNHLSVSNENLILIDVKLTTSTSNSLVIKYNREFLNTRAFNSNISIPLKVIRSSKVDFYNGHVFISILSLNGLLVGIPSNIVEILIKNFNSKFITLTSSLISWIKISFHVLNVRNISNNVKCPIFS